MWEHQCSAERKRGGRCTRKSTTAVWTFTFQGEKFEHATWVETCTQHVAETGSTVAMMSI